jgi:sugar phosphate isomerase/epimerase
MNPMTRRQFARHLSMATLSSTALLSRASEQSGAPSSKRSMTMCLVCGMIGVSANQVQAIDLAHRHGFESVEAYGEQLADLPEQQLNELLSGMKAKRIAFGAAGLPVDFRQDENRFQESLGRLPKTAAGLRRAGVDRVGTWISPGHDTLTYLQNFKQHAARLRQVAQILGDHGQRLGLEYVGTVNSRIRRKFQFVHTFAETGELIAGIGLTNVGFVLDSWHWWTAGDTMQDILSLRNQQIVAVDLNDAPAGLAKVDQIDNRRELPCATGVIDLGTFLNALNRLGYSGPVRAEPFNKTLNDLDNEAACATTSDAMKKAFALIR